MISFVKGPLVDILEDAVVIEAGYVGLEVRVPLSVLERLPDIGKETILYTYFQVREDGMCLYGFLNRQDLKMFKQLLSVSGIGPKGALGLLSAMAPDDLRSAVVSGDAKAISRAPGIGIKTSQRIILELKDKIDMTDLEGGRFALAAGIGIVSEGIAGEAVEALVALGYSAAQAGRAVSRVELKEGMTSEEVLKASLKHLAFL